RANLSRQRPRKEIFASGSIIASSGATTPRKSLQRLTLLRLRGLLSQIISQVIGKLRLLELSPGAAFEVALSAERIRFIDVRFIIDQAPRSAMCCCVRPSCTMLGKRFLNLPNNRCKNHGQSTSAEHRRS